MKTKNRKLVRITTVPISLKFLLAGQMKYMQENGFEVTMMSAEGPEIEEVVEKEGCPHLIIPLTRQITPFKDLKALWILYRALIKIGPDIVHSHTPKAGLIGMIAAWLARVPVRLHTVAGLPLETAQGNKKILLIYIEKLTYFFATEVWPNSNSLFSYIKDTRLTKSSKLRLIKKGSSNGIDSQEFNSQSLDYSMLDSIKNQINYKKEFIYLLFVGRVVKDKGIEELVDAFTLLCQKHKNLKLVIVGPLEQELDPLPNKTMTIIDQNEDIIMVGFSNQVKYFMSLADLFVFPSHREGFPNVPMQAALMDCPVIASEINGNIDIIDHRINGLLHEKGNVLSLEKNLDYALNNSKEMHSYAKALKRKVIENFERNMIHQEIFETYLSELAYE